MYEYPQYNFSTDPNSGYNNYQQQQQPAPQPPKKKKTGAGLIIGVLIAAIVVGSASGFGGSYLASRLQDDTSQSQPADNDNTPSSSDEQEDPEETTEATTPEYHKPDTKVSNDLGTLENTVNMNTTVQYSYEELFDRVNESIVVVKNYVQSNSMRGSESDQGNYTLYGTGSGVIFTTDGYIVTNHHVVEGNSKISVVISDAYSDEEEIEAVVVGSDSATDLAILKISRDQPFTAVALGDSSSLKIGQEVCAIGNPAGLNKTITNGIISGLNRFASEEGGYELSSIQTNAAINPGNSGGGLFDLYGNVVGIVNSKLVSQSSSTTLENLGFAITINEAKPVISDLINYGFVTGRPTIGITTMQINEYTAQLYGLYATGLLVTDIDEDAPVAKSDLRIGDVITKVNGKDVESVSDVQAITKGMHAGDKITLTVSRVIENDSYFGFNSSGRVTTLDIDVELTENKG